MRCTGGYGDSPLVEGLERLGYKTKTIVAFNASIANNERAL